MAKFSISQETSTILIASSIIDKNEAVIIIKIDLLAELKINFKKQ